MFYCNTPAWVIIQVVVLQLLYKCVGCHVTNQLHGGLKFSCPVRNIKILYDYLSNILLGMVPVVALSTLLTSNQVSA